MGLLIFLNVEVEYSNAAGKLYTSLFVVTAGKTIQTPLDQRHSVGLALDTGFFDPQIQARARVNRMKKRMRHPFKSVGHSIDCQAGTLADRIRPGDVPNREARMPVATPDSVLRMQAATVLSLILGGLGAASGTSVSLMQWRERRRKLLVVSTWLTAGYVENKVDYLLLLEVVNPTLEPVKVKTAGVFWAANQEMLFPLRPESGRRYKQPDHYTYDDDGLQYEATIPGRGSQETYGYVSDLRQVVSAGDDGGPQGPN